MNDQMKPHGAESSEVLNLNCPACGSSNTQKLSLLVMGGTQSSRTRSTGVGLIGGDVGVGMASSNNRSITALAKAYSPPRKRSAVGALIFGLLLGLLVSIFAGWAGFIGGVIGGVVGFIVNHKYHKNVYLPGVSRWNSSFLCLRCSHSFTPAPAPRIAGE